MSNPTDNPHDDHRSPRRPRRAVSLALAGIAAASALIVVPTSGTSHAYSTGVKSLTFTPAADSCIEGQALPCSPGAAIGDANVLRVTQSVVNGYHQFNGLTGTSADADSIWVAVNYGAECRWLHDMTKAQIDESIWNTGEWAGLDTSGLGDGSDQWPFEIPLPSGRTIPVERRAVHLPIDIAFGADLIGWFPDEQDVFDVGEAEIERRMDDEGMSAAEARGLPFEIDTVPTLAAEVVCDLPGLAAPRYKRATTQIPLSIVYEPVTVAPAGPGAHQPADDLALPQVTQAELSIVQDPADPCTLHLSGVIATNSATDVEYRWVNQYGQPSNTFSLHVDHTQVGYVEGTVQVPHADTADISGEWAPSGGGGGGGDIGDEVAVVDDTMYSGTFELEVVSPNFVHDIDGFSVPYCTAPAPVRVNPEVGGTVGGVTAGPRPTHG